MYTYIYNIQKNYCNTLTVNKVTSAQMLSRLSTSHNNVNNDKSVNQ